MGNKAKDNFNKNLYITYIDEVENYTFPNANFKSIVSISMKKIDYINCIEKKWDELRRKYEVPTGVILHFTDIKALLNQDYFNRNVKNRNLDLEGIFCKDGKVNEEKIYNFYMDIIKIIKDCNFDIIVTGRRFEKTEMLKDRIVKDTLHSEWYILFKEHLDNLASYMLKKSYERFIREGRKKLKISVTKLRVDGDYGLISRGDFRDAFAEVICNGTNRYSRSFTRRCLDSLKFVDKSEVGSRYISHAGNELTDFITLYAGKGKYKEEFLDDFVKNGRGDMDEAQKFYNKGMKILVNGKNIYPFNEIYPKIYK